MGSASMQRRLSAGDAGVAERAGSKAATASVTSSSFAWALSRLEEWWVGILKECAIARRLDRRGKGTVLHAAAMLRSKSLDKQK
jgi:hypothetical protein